MEIIDNEVEVNLDMKSDVHIGGEILIFEKGCMSQIKATPKSKYLAVIRLITYFVNLFVTL